MFLLWLHTANPLPKNQDSLDDERKANEHVVEDTNNPYYSLIFRTTVNFLFSIFFYFKSNILFHSTVT